MLLFCHRVIRIESSSEWIAQLCIGTVCCRARSKHGMENVREGVAVIYMLRMLFCVWERAAYA